jgi:HlyD family secretion protein
MTANVTVNVDARSDVLTVPNAALRFRPEDQPQTTKSRRSGPVVWRVEGRELKPVTVRAGLTDGIVTEVTGLNEGDTVAVPAQNAQAKAGARPQQGQSSPFGMRPRTGGVRR